MQTVRPTDGPRNQVTEVADVRTDRSERPTEMRANVAKKGENWEKLGEIGNRAPYKPHNRGNAATARQANINQFST